jgi:hypothetical protein
MLVSIATVVAVVRISDQHSLEDIEQRFGRASTLAVRSALARQLASAAPLLAEARGLAEHERLAVDDPAALGEHLVDKVRYQPEISYFMYADQATGRFVGARRRNDGAIVLVIVARDLEQGRPMEWHVARDGTRTPLTSALPGDYDPRARPWYHLATAQDQVAWTAPYRFASSVFPHLVMTLAGRGASGGAK